MRCIGNFEEWISQEWIDYIAKSDGHRQEDPNKAKANIPFSGLTWELFDRHNTDFNISPPIDFGTHEWQWWFKKLLPGKGFPVVTLSETTRRFWMPLTHYQTGHIFIYEEQMIAPFNKGDLFEFEHNAPYASVNLGIDPFYMMMFSVSNDTQWGDLPVVNKI